MVKVSSFTDARVLLSGANRTESTKLICTLRADEVGSSAVVFSWLFPIYE